MPAFAIAFVAVSILLSWLLAAVRGQRALAHRFPVYDRRLMPRVSILVPAWNERTILARCVSSLKRLEYPDWECILIAGGKDNTRDAERAQELVAGVSNFRVIPQRPGGKNAALNDGLRLSTGDIVVLLDADCEVEPDWLGALIAPIAAGAGAASGNYFPDVVTPISLQFELNKVSTYFVRRAAPLHGGAIALSRSALDALGGSFPETVLVGTDWDLSARLERLGVSKVFVPAARHTTPLPSTWPQFIRNEIRWRRGHFRAVQRSCRSGATGWAACVLGLAPYAVGVLLVGIPVALPLLHFLHPALSAYLGQGWVLYIVWVSGRRIGQVIEAAAYQHDARWLKLFWVPPATLLVSLCCCVIALISLRRLSPYFKGQRPQPVAENPHG